MVIWGTLHYSYDVCGLYSEDINEALELYNKLIAKAKALGYEQAAYNLEYFLDVSPNRNDTISMPLDWLKSFGEFKDALDVNYKRMKDDIGDAAKTMSREVLYLGNYWDSIVQLSNRRFELSELFYASGDSTLHSQYHLILKKNDCKVSVKGKIFHLWYDVYDWHAGLGVWIPTIGYVPDDLGLILEQAGLGRSYKMETKWEETVSGTYSIGFLCDSDDIHINNIGSHNYDMENLKHRYRQSTAYEWD